MTAGPLHGRVALVSGASRGVGRGIALRLGAAGASVAVNYRSAAAAAGQTVAEIEAAGGFALAVAASVDDSAACEAVVDRVTDAMGPVSILVNNAGLASRGDSAVETDPSEVVRLFTVHALGSLHLCRLIVPGMRQAGVGDVVFISSIATRDHPEGGAPYTMAKAALEALAMTLAKEEWRHGIRVNIVAPGLVATDMGSRMVAAAFGVDDITDLGAGLPHGRVCRPEDVGGVIVAMVTGAPFVSGQRIYIDGGIGGGWMEPYRPR